MPFTKNNQPANRGNKIGSVREINKDVKRLMAIKSKDLLDQLNKICIQKTGLDYITFLAQFVLTNERAGIEFMKILFSGVTKPNPNDKDPEANKPLVVIFKTINQEQSRIQAEGKIIEQEQNDNK